MTILVSDLIAERDRLKRYLTKPYKTLLNLNQLPSHFVVSNGLIYKVCH